MPRPRVTPRPAPDPDQAMVTPLLAAPVWTPEDMAAVLAAVTQYPFRGGTPGRGEALVSQLGGRHVVRQLLWEYQALLPASSQWVLNGFLAGSTRVQVVASVSTCAPMHAATVYKQIQMLPATLAPYFLARLDQMVDGPPLPPLHALLHTLHTCRALLQHLSITHK